MNKEGRKAVFRVKTTVQGDYNCLYESDTINGILSWVDLVLRSTNNFSIFSELNDLQSDIKVSGREPPLKDEFPLRIYNYILKRYRLEIVEA